MKFPQFFITEDKYKIIQYSVIAILSTCLVRSIIKLWEVMQDNLSTLSKLHAVIWTSTFLNILKQIIFFSVGFSLHKFDVEGIRYITDFFYGTFYLFWAFSQIGFFNLYIFSLNYIHKLRGGPKEIENWQYIAPMLLPLWPLLTLLPWNFYQYERNNILNSYGKLKEEIILKAKITPKLLVIDKSQADLGYFGQSLGLYTTMLMNISLFGVSVVALWKIFKILQYTKQTKKELKEMKNDWLVFFLFGFAIYFISLIDSFLVLYEIIIVKNFKKDDQVKYYQTSYCFNWKYLSEENKNQMKEGSLYHITTREIVYIIIENILLAIQMSFFAPGSYSMKK